MRVLYVHSGNMYGGVETLLTTLARHRDLSPAMEPHYALCFDGCLSEELTTTGVPVHLLCKARIRQPLTVLRARRLLADLLRQQCFDLVVCHSTWSQSLFGPVVRAARLPLVFWLHCPTNGKPWLDRWGSKTTPDLVLYNSRFTAAASPHMFPQVRSEVVYCATAPPQRDYSKAARALTRAEYQTSDDAVVIIQASRMEAWKGHALHLEALSAIKDLPNWICWQLGGAQRPKEIEYLEGLKRKATQLGIGDRVLFLGPRADVEKLMAAADVYCQPNTDAEPFGISFIEALYAQLPVVTTAIGGACEIVDETCGLLVPQNDAPALAKSLTLLIENRILRLGLGAAGPARARDLCDVKIQMQRLQKIFLRVCGIRDQNKIEPRIAPDRRAPFAVA